MFSLILRDHQDLKVHRDQEEKKATLDPGSVSVSELVFIWKIFCNNILDFRLDDVSQSFELWPTTDKEQISFLFKCKFTDKKKTKKHTKHKLRSVKHLRNMLSRVNSVLINVVLMTCFLGSWRYPRPVRRKGQKGNAWSQGKLQQGLTRSLK